MKMLVVVLSSFLFTFVSLFEERLFFLRPYVDKGLVYVYIFVILCGKKAKAKA